MSNGSAGLSAGASFLVDREKRKALPRLGMQTEGQGFATRLGRSRAGLVAAYAIAVLACPPDGLRAAMVAAPPELAKVGATLPRPG